MLNTQGLVRLPRDCEIDGDEIVSIITGEPIEVTDYCNCDIDYLCYKVECQERHWAEMERWIPLRAPKPFAEMSVA
jgi:hypothetical protein